MKLLFKSFGIILNFLSAIAPKLSGKWGMFLFCYPIKIKIQPFHRNYLDSATRVDFKFQNKNVAAYKWGNGEKTILFVHGWNSYSFRWKKYIDAFVSQGYTVYAFDGPGNGLSQGNQLNVKIYADCINLLSKQIGKIDLLVAHSFGGFAAIFAASLEPQLQANKYIIMGSAENASNFFLFYKEMLGLSQKTLDHIVNSFVKVLGNPPEYYQAQEFAKSLNKPCLIIHDVDDHETPYQGALAIHNNWKGSILHSVKNSGHQLRTPDVLEKVISFVVEKETALV